MPTLEQLNKIEIQINQFRLDLIKIISEINRMLSLTPKATRTNEYKALKQQYHSKQEEIYYLRTLKKEISRNGPMAA